MSSAALAALLQESSEELGLKEAHASLITMALVTIGAVSDTLSLGPVEWLEGASMLHAGRVSTRAASSWGSLPTRGAPRRYFLYTDVRSMLMGL